MKKAVARVIALGGAVAVMVPIAVLGFAGSASAAPGSVALSDSVEHSTSVKPTSSKRANHSMDPAHLALARAVDPQTVARTAALRAAGEKCPAPATGTVGTTAGFTSELGVVGTTDDDLAEFATAYNTIRVGHCLEPIPLENFRHDSCMESRLVWMAEDPSTDPASAWGHLGTSVRSDGVPEVGCDGNIAGGTNNTASTVAQKWWDSEAHRASLYKPDASVEGVCITFAMTHGGVPNEPYPFTRASASWVSCDSL